MARSRRRRWPWILLGAIAVAFASCYAAVVVVRTAADLEAVTPREFFAGKPAILNIAHRGASGYEREHTLEAYDRALALGADVLELDVRRTRDGHVVVHHDGSLERTHGRATSVADSTLAGLRAAGGGAEPPTLADVFARYPGIAMNIELKQPEPALADDVAALVAQHGREDSVLVASFYAEALRRFRERSGGRVATSASASEAARFYLCYALDIPCRATYAALQVPLGIGRSLRLDFADPEFIEFAHRHGLEVHYWTIDDPAVMRRLIAAGADGIMTNYPDRAADVIRAAAPLQ